MGGVDIFTGAYTGPGAAITINEDDGIQAVSVTVTGAGTSVATITGTLKLGSVSPSTISIASGESITISAGSGNVLDNITITRATGDANGSNTTQIVARQ